MGKLYTCSDIAERYDVPVGTIWLWIRKKTLPAVKVGKYYRIREKDIEAFEEARSTINRKGE